MGTLNAELSVPNIPELIVQASAGTLEHMVHEQLADGRHGFAHRLKQALSDAGYQDWGAGVRLARELGISARAVGKWLNGETMPDTKRLEQLAALLRVSVEWLLTGKSPNQVNDMPANYAIPASIGTAVPVIGLATAVAVCLGNSPLPEVNEGNGKPVLMALGKRTFYIQVGASDDSMVSSNPLEKSYPPGSFVCIDPDKDDPTGSRAVLALVDGSDTPVLRRVGQQAGQRWLYANNDRYPRIERPFTVLGWAWGKWED